MDSILNNKLPFLQAQGTLQHGALYVHRTTDETLYSALLSGEYGHILAPRQIGKSSLTIWVAQRLSQVGIRSVLIDLTQTGRSADRDPLSTWYYGLIDELASQLSLPDPQSIYYGQYGNLAPVQRFRRYIHDVILQQVTGQVVIFIDEIEYVRSLPAAIDTDEFFAALRGLYNERARDSEWKRLSFCLVGVAAPGDLVKDAVITPFNIGATVRLEDFRREEIAPFGSHLASLDGDVQIWLDEIFRWTHGHPHMTQLLCMRLLRQRPVGPIKEVVSSCVRRHFLLNGREELDNLAYAEKRIDDSYNAARKRDLMGLYRRLLLAERVPAEGGDPLQAELELCGLAATRESEGRRMLVVRNAIVGHVFGPSWVREKEGQRKLGTESQRWLEAARNPTLLLRGDDLEEAQRWAREHPDDLSLTENDFLRESLAIAAREREAQAVRAAREEAREREIEQARQLAVAERARAELEARSARRLRGLSITLFFAFAAAATGGFFARQQQQRAVAQEKFAKDQEKIANKNAASARESQLQEGVARKAAEDAGALVTKTSKELQIALNDTKSALLQKAEALKKEQMARQGEAVALKQAQTSADIAEKLARSEQQRAADEEVKRIAAEQKVVELQRELGLQMTRAEQLAIQPGQEREALESAINAVALSMKDGHAPPQPALQSLFAALKPNWEKGWPDLEKKVAITLKTSAGVSTFLDAAFSAKGDYVLAVSGDGTLFRWSYGGEPRGVKNSDSPRPCALQLSAKRESLFAMLPNGAIREVVFDRAGLQSNVIAHSSTTGSACCVMALDDSGGYLAAVGRGGAVMWWSLSNDAPQPVPSPRTSVDSVTAIAISARARQLAIGYRDGGLLLCGLSAPLSCHVLDGKRAAIDHLGFSLDGDRLAVADAQGGVGVFSTHVENRTASWFATRNSSPVNSLSFSQDGLRLVTTHGNGIALVRNAVDGTTQARLNEQGAAINHAELDPQAIYAVTASGAARASLWLPNLDDRKRGPQSLALALHPGYVQVARFSANGERIVTAGQGGTARLYRVGARALFEHACNILGQLDKSSKVYVEKCVIFSATP